MSTDSPRSQSYWEDVPEIDAITLDFDQEPENTKVTIKNLLSSRGCMKLDLPRTFHILKVDCFKTKSRHKTDAIKFKRQLDNNPAENERILRQRSGLLRVLRNGDIPDWKSESEDTEMKLEKDRHTPESAAGAGDNKELELCELIGQVTIGCNGLRTTSPMIERFGNTQPNPDKESEFAQKNNSAGQSILDEGDFYKGLPELLKLAFDFENSEETLLSSTASKDKAVNSKTGLSLLSSSLNLDTKKLKLFQLYPHSPILESLRYAGGSTIFPDVAKKFAFRHWQNRETDRCTYYLSQSHGAFLKTDILDRHNAYFCKPEDDLNFSVNKDSKIEATKLLNYRQQSKDLTEFGRSINNFYESINEFDPDWNIVQLTTLFPIQNRFGASFSEDTQTPPLFLTCLSHVPGDDKRHSFVTYIPTPQTDTGDTKYNVMAEFKKVMMGNRSINEKYVGDRRKYWDVREQHNRQLSAVLDAIQDVWLCPWYFLLPGNVVDKDTRTKISNFIRAVELALNKKLTGFQKVAFYKLTENYGCLSESIRGAVPDMIAYIIGAQRNKVRKITQRLVEIGSSINSKAERHPTILVLDQGVEQLPLDWIRCLRETSVTRVQSMSILYSLTKLYKMRSPVDPRKCMYILNPDLSLKSVQARLEEYFKARRTWHGVVGKKPTFQEVDHALQTQDVFLYCGHGSGQCLYPDYLLQKTYCRAIPILMGCGSAQYKYLGPGTHSTSVVNSYFVAACPSVVGFLWEITDVECDRITVELLEHWTPGHFELPKMTSFDSESLRTKVSCLATAVRLSRHAATQFLTSAGIVNYGIPINRKTYEVKPVNGLHCQPIVVA